MNIEICDDEENVRIYIRRLIERQEPSCKITEFSISILKFTLFSQKISTHLLTVLTIGVILQLEQKKQRKGGRTYDGIRKTLSNEKRYTGKG